MTSDRLPELLLKCDCRSAMWRMRAGRHSRHYAELKVRQFTRSRAPFEDLEHRKVGLCSERLESGLEAG